MTIKRAITYSIAINLFFLVLCLVFGDLNYGAVDDYFMAGVLTGIHGTGYNPHLVFVNAIYGYALLPLYYLFPKVGWYYIGEVFAVFVSFSVVSLVLLRRMGEQWGGILSFLFVALFASDFYLAVQFTRCAAILSSAGMLLIGYWICEDSIAFSQTKKWIWLIVLGILLLWWGSAMRWQAFLMGLPFFAFFLLLQCRRCWKRRWPFFAAMLILFLGAFAAQKWDRSLYNKAEYRTFMNFQSARVTLGDDVGMDDQAVYEDLEELGYSGIDFAMLREWTMYDKKVFSLDSLRPILESINRHRQSAPWQRFPYLLMTHLEKSVQAPIFWAWLVTCLIVFFTNQKKAIYLFGSFGIILLLMVKLLMMQRFVYRVESGFWLYAAVLAIPFMGKLPSVPARVSRIIILLVALINIYLYAVSGDVVRDNSTGQKRTLRLTYEQDSSDYASAFAFMDSMMSNMVYLTPMKAYMCFSHHKNPPYMSEPVGSWRNIIPLGYWTPYYPDVESALKDFGLDNPLENAVNDNVIVIDDWTLANYLQRHYYDSVAVDTLRDFKGLTFLKYHLIVDSTKINPAEVDK